MAEEAGRRPLELRLLGVPELSWAGRSVPPPPRKNLALLCYLAVQEEPRTRSELAELLWGAGKSDSVRVALHALRSLPGAAEWLSTEGQLVEVLAVTDVARFESALREHSFGAALEAWGEGPERSFLHGLELRGAEAFGNWVEAQRERLEALYLEGLRGRALELERAGEHAAALRIVDALLERDRLDEPSYRAAMRLERERGDAEAARNYFERCRRVLHEELGIEPAPETLELLREIEGGGRVGAKSAALLGEDPVPALPGRLVGREALLEELEALLEGGGRVLLHGFGGAGKTAVAAALAARWLTEGGTVLWLEAGDDGPDSIFDALARPFAATRTIGRAQGQARLQAVARLLRDEGITLLVVDDAWNSYTVSRLLQALPEGLALLVTSRLRHQGLTRRDVGRLPRAAALELLSLHAGRELATGPDAPDAIALCELLGDHAFALRVAGVTMAVDALMPGALLERLSSAPHALALPPSMAGEDVRSVAALLGASLEALPDEAYEAFLAMGALFSPTATPELLALCTRREAEEVEDALITLQLRGLAERQAAAGSDAVSYRIHDLAFSFARANSSIRASTVVRAAKAFLARAGGDFDVVEAELANLLAAAQAALERGDRATLVEMMRLLTVGEAYFGARGHTPRSLELLREAAFAARQLEQLDTAHFLVTKLGNAYRELLADHSRALEAYEEALALARRLGLRQREAIALSLVGSVRFELGAADADGFLSEAYRLAREAQDDLALSHVLQNLSYLAGQRQDFEAARRLCRESVDVALRLREDAAVDQAEVAHKLFFSLLNLGVAQQRLGHADEAREEYRRALRLAEEHDNRVWQAYALQELGELHGAMGERQLALEHLKRALALYRQNRARADAAAVVEVMRSLELPVPDDAEV